MEKKNIIIVHIVAAIILAASLAGNIVQFKQYRSAIRTSSELLNELQTRCSDAESTCSKLRGQLELNDDELSRVKEIVGNIATTTNRQVDSIDNCISLVATIREEVQNMEKNIVDRNSNSSGDNVDSNTSF